MQFKSMAAIKARISAAIVQLDELQLEEPDSSSSRYKALGDVKTDLEAAKNLVEGRMDLIERVDGSKVGWLAATAYEKANGPLKKSDSDKLWCDAEKACLASSEYKRRESQSQQPFRDLPARAGKDAYNPRARGVYSFFLMLTLCFLAPIPAGFCICDCLFRRNGEEIRISRREISNFFRMTEKDTVCK